jgi:hypothetical protein
MKSGPGDPAIDRKTLISRRSAGLLLASCLVAPVRALASSSALSSEIVARSQLSAGDPGRLINLFAKARRGEPITLGVIGGSITVGAFATRAQNSYAGRLLTWWRQQFPRCDIRMVNAGLGGTGSMYGALRVGKDLLSSTPDFVVIEFAVNDNWTDGEAFEGLVRQVLAQPNLPAVLLLFMMWEKGGNDQAMQAKVGAHYHLPMVSFRDALWPEMAAGRLKWSDYIVDTVHPLPAPLFSDTFQHVRWRDATALDPLENSGWRLDPGDKGIAAWNSAAASARISFDWSGSGLVAIFADPPDDVSRIRFCIDGAALQTLEALKEPRRQVFVLAQDLTPGRHIVELIDDGGGSQTAGQKINLLGIAGIGPNGNQHG